MRRLGIFLRVLGAILIMASMAAEVALFRTKDLAFAQKYFYLSLASGLLFYVIGMALMKPKKNRDHLKVVPPK